jgi:hypothetical protein
LFSLDNKKINQIFGIAVLCSILIYIVLEKNKIFNEQITPQTIVHLQKFEDINQKKLYGLIDELLKKYKLTCITESFTGKRYQCLYESSYKKSIEFLDALALKFYLESFSIVKIEKKVQVHFSLLPKGFFQKNSYKNELNIFLNPFEINSTKNIKTIAIFENYIYIENIWYQLGDIYKGGKIVEIKNSSFVYRKNNNNYEVVLFEK